MRKFSTFESYGFEDWVKTSWSIEIGGSEKSIGILELEELMSKLNSQQVEIPIDDIWHLCVHKSKRAKETKERSQESDLSFPIIICKDLEGNYSRILDGNHRLMKAKTLGEKYITAKVLELKEVKKMKEFLELTLRMFT
jgi:hypothetical protein